MTKRDTGFRCPHRQLEALNARAAELEPRRRALGLELVRMHNVICVNDRERMLPVVRLLAFDDLILVSTIWLCWRDCNYMEVRILDHRNEWLARAAREDAAVGNV